MQRENLCARITEVYGRSLSHWDWVQLGRIGLRATASSYIELYGKFIHWIAHIVTLLHFYLHVLFLKPYGKTLPL